MAARRKRDCGAQGCSERIKASRYFCKRHFSLLPKAMRDEMMEARRGYGMGGRLIPWLNEAREFLQNYEEKQKVTKGRSEIIDITLEPRMVRGKAQAFFQGDMKEDTAGNFTEEWIWLPLSQIEVGEKDKNGTCEVSMPEWLATEKGLI